MRRLVTNMRSLACLKEATIVVSAFSRLAAAGVAAPVAVYWCVGG